MALANWIAAVSEENSAVIDISLACVHILIFMKIDTISLH